VKIRKPGKPAVADVPADNPQGTMDRFTAGLKRVICATPKRISPSTKSVRGKRSD